MAAASTDWPEGLKDEEAVLRLQSVLIAACQGNRDLANDRDYRRLRAPLIRLANLSDVVPRYIRAHRDLTSLWSYLRGISDQWEPRRQHIWETFRPLLDRIEGITSAPVQSGKWTGRRTAAQQAKVVLAIGPDALHAVQMLLNEQEKALHNGGPIDPEQQEAIEKLKELRNALSELIAGRPLSGQIQRLRGLKNAAFRWSKETLGLMVSEHQLIGSSMVVGCGAMLLINAISKGTAEGIAMGSVSLGSGSTACWIGVELADVLPTSRRRVENASESYVRFPP